MPRVVEGEQILGRFTVGERIGGGGHGTVNRAWDERLCRWVAVKAVAGEGAGRVLREAHAAARLNHPGIVTLYEMGSQNGCAYLVSELVDGPNLRQLAAAAAISDREVAELGAELCAALAHAHDGGVIHRDVKPDNVLVRGRGSRKGSFSRSSGERALLADFGIATLDDAPSLTATGHVVGTLAYMSPEQAAGDPVGPATDVYSLALTLYELWSGYNPVERPTPAATARAIGAPVPPLSEARPELPEALSEAIDACLDPDPDLRPPPSLLRESLLMVRGELHPDRAVPEPEASDSPAAAARSLPFRSLAVLVAATVLILGGALAGLPGLALVTALLLAPAALMLSRPSEWLAPVLAPFLGIIGVAPAFLGIAARHERPGARAALAGLAWAWTGFAGGILGRGLGVPVGEGGLASEWASSAGAAMDGLTAALLTPTSIAVGLIWVGGAVLLGVLLDVTKPAGAAVGGLIWSAGVTASLAAAGPGAAPSPLLAPGLMAAVAWAIWDAHGRPWRAEWLEAMPALDAVAARLPFSQPPPEAPSTPRAPRNPAATPIANEEIRLTRTATRHVRAALHGAGSRAGLP